MLNGLVQMCPGPFPVCHSSSLSPDFPFYCPIKIKASNSRIKTLQLKKTKTKNLCCAQLTATEHNISVNALVHIGSRL